MYVILAAADCFVSFPLVLVEDVALAPAVAALVFADEVGPDEGVDFVQGVGDLDTVLQELRPHVLLQTRRLYRQTI